MNPQEIFNIVKDIKHNIWSSLHMNPQEIFNIVKDIKHCYDTVLEYYYGKNRLVRIMREDYEDYGENKGYTKYVVDEVVTELNCNGMIGIMIENGSGGMNDQTFDHSFILHKLNGKVFRIESYVDIYCTRIIEDSSYRENLTLLLNSTPGKERLSIWNNIFSSHENRDTNEPLDVSIYSRNKG